MIQTIKRATILLQDYNDFKAYILRAYNVYLIRNTDKKKSYKKFVKKLIKAAEVHAKKYTPDYLYFQLQGSRCSIAIPELYLIRMSLWNLSKQVSSFISYSKDEAELSISLDNELAVGLLEEKFLQDGTQKEEAEKKVEAIS
ncbi:hypothetical protein [Pontibacter fetidus]|uniref:Uncharacterized protein n=1 Tax=Pontibacter fetidus TaxID=2700082 RepID=A0A6B2H8X5_9BACT|nr:hypothetical protein [Pontibacter fetidus]NDK57586.1 hypothetical protein [Pontibacter fetidus]